MSNPNTEMRTNEEFVANASECPRCHAADCEYDSWEIVDKESQQEACCPHCGLEWLEVYTLTGYVVTRAGPDAEVFTLMDLATRALATAEEQCEGCGEGWPFLGSDKSEHATTLDEDGSPVTQGCTAARARAVVAAIKDLP